MINTFRPEIDKYYYEFAGHAGMNETTGLTYMNARWMDNSTGRFISVDPAKDGFNWYIYAANNPTTLIDPTGLEGEQAGNNPMVGSEAEPWISPHMQDLGGYTLLLQGQINTHRDQGYNTPEIMEYELMDEYEKYDIDTIWYNFYDDLSYLGDLYENEDDAEIGFGKHDKKSILAGLENNPYSSFNKNNFNYQGLVDLYTALYTVDLGGDFKFISPDAANLLEYTNNELDQLSLISFLSYMVIPEILKEGAQESAVLDKLFELAQTEIRMGNKDVIFPGKDLYNEAFAKMFLGGSVYLNIGIAEAYASSSKTGGKKYYETDFSESHVIMSRLKDKLKSSVNNSAGDKGILRNPNKLAPNPEAVGPHTSYRTNSGKITNYETYNINNYTGKYTAVKRFRGIGKPHGGVEPPLIYEPLPGKGIGAPPKVPRSPFDWELPIGY